MTGCSVPLCAASSAKGVRCFRFPQEKARRRKWESCVKRDRWKASHTSRICERHFEEDQYEMNRQDGRRLLKRTAVPTLFDFRRKCYYYYMRYYYCLCLARLHAILFCVYICAVFPFSAQRSRSEESPPHRELLRLIVEVPPLQVLRQFLRQESQTRKTLARRTLRQTPFQKKMCSTAGTIQLIS